MWQLFGHKVVPTQCRFYHPKMTMFFCSGIEPIAGRFMAARVYHIDTIWLFNSLPWKITIFNR